jgi:hypothetical protein
MEEKLNCQRFAEGERKETVEEAEEMTKTTHLISYTPLPVRRNERIHRISVPLVNHLMHEAPLCKSLPQIPHHPLPLRVHSQALGELLLRPIDVKLVCKGEGGGREGRSAGGELDVEEGGRHGFRPGGGDSAGDGGDAFARGGAEAACHSRTELLEKGVSVERRKVRRFFPSSLMRGKEDRWCLRLSSLSPL